MSRVTTDSVRNEPVPFEDYERLVEAVLDIFDVPEADLVSVHLTAKAIRAKVAVRNKRGQRLHDSWAHLVRRIDYPEVDDVQA